MAPVTARGSFDDLIAPTPARSRPSPRKGEGGAGRAIRIVLAVLIPLVIVVAAIAGGEIWARAAVGGEIRAALADGFHVEPDAVNVDLGGDLALIQLVNQSFAKVTADVRGADLGDASGDVHVTITGLPLDRSLPVGALGATVTIPQDSIAALVTDTTSLVPESVTIAPGVVTVAATLDLGIVGQFPVSVDLSPSAGPGSISLAPVALEINGTSVPAADIRSLPILGEFIAPMIASREYCIADRIPQGLTVDRLEATDGALVVDLSGTGVVVDETLGRAGVCG